MLIQIGELDDIVIYVPQKGRKQIECTFGFNQIFSCIIQSMLDRWMDPPTMDLPLGSSQCHIFAK